MRRIFWGFCRNWFLMSPLHYPSSCSDFSFEFAEIFIFVKRLPASLIRGVANSQHHGYGEMAIEFFKRKLSVSMIQRVVDSPHQWYGESLTPCIVESENRRLRVLPIRRVDDSSYRWVRESMTPRIGNTRESLFKEKKNLVWISELLLNG